MDAHRARSRGRRRRRTATRSDRPRPRRDRRPRPAIAARRPPPAIARVYVSVSPSGGGSGLVGAERRVLLEGAVNFRDLGGYATTDGRRTRWGSVFRSDAFHALTDEDRQAVRRARPAGPLRPAQRQRADLAPEPGPGGRHPAVGRAVPQLGRGRDRGAAAARAAAGGLGVPAPAVPRHGRRTVHPSSAPCCRAWPNPTRSRRSSTACGGRTGPASPLRCCSARSACPRPTWWPTTS